MKIQTILSLIPRIIQLLTQLFWIWATLGWKVRKARKAFEKELILQGITKGDAKRLSRQIKMLKDQIMGSIWQAAFK